MANYTKLFNSIVTSSIWSEDDKTRILWVTLLALADRSGMVEAAIPGLANAARISVKDCEDALRKFESPDPYSRSTEHEGRRLKKVNGGWILLNHALYRHKMSADDRAEYQRIKQAVYRARKNGLPLVGETEYLEYLKRGDSDGAQKVLEKYLPPTVRKSS
jgi:hypothetical protein